MSMVLAMLLVAAMLVPVSAEQQAPTDDFTLTVLHTNDTHANIEPCTGYVQQRQPGWRCPPLHSHPAG